MPPPLRDGCRPLPVPALPLAPPPPAPSPGGGASPQRRQRLQVRRGEQTYYGVHGGCRSGIYTTWAGIPGAEWAPQGVRGANVEKLLTSYADAVHFASQETHSRSGVRYARGLDRPSTGLPATRPGGE
eukprot:4841877-Pleurochrysis_carterae.AAC.1